MTLLYTCPHDPMRQAHAWTERDAEVVIGCLKCPRDCPGPDHIGDVNEMIEPPSNPRELDPDGELWEELARC